MEWATIIISIRIIQSSTRIERGFLFEYWTWIEGIESIDKERANVEKQWIKELKEATTKPKFDAYSKKGEKVIKKITNKFSPIFFELDSEREILVARNNEIVDEFEKKSKKNK